VRRRERENWEGKAARWMMIDQGREGSLGAIIGVTEN
jgi:hypothetical protein